MLLHPPAPFKSEFALPTIQPDHFSTRVPQPIRCRSPRYARSRLTSSFLALIAYGNFWFTYAAFVYPGLGLSAAFADHPGQLRVNSAIGIFLAAWFIITFIFL